MNKNKKKTYIEEMKGFFKKNSSVFVTHYQGLTVKDIDSCINKIIQKDAESVIAVHQLEDHHPARIKKIVNDKILCKNFL